MQSILNQAKNDPAALQNHMQNATIRTKIQKVGIPINPSCCGDKLTIATVDRSRCDPIGAVVNMSVFSRSKLFGSKSLICDIGVCFPCI